MSMGWQRKSAAFFDNDRAGSCGSTNDHKRGDSVFEHPGFTNVGPRIRSVLLIGITLLLAAPAMAAVCGNHVIELGEQCDDGNTLGGDCCSPSCQFESSSTVCRSAAAGCDFAE